MTVRIITSPPYMTDKQIETRAMRLLANHARQENVRLEKPPVNVHAIAEFHLELNLLYDDIEQDEGAIILASINPYTKTICMNTHHIDLFKEVIGPEKFTVAHEIGHWELHIIKDGWVQYQLPLGGSEPIEQEMFLCRANQTDRREIQANKFAAALLMPQYLVKEAIQGENLSDYGTIIQLADRFQVSRQAMQIRLKTLGYLDESGRLIQQKGLYPEDVLF